MPPSEEPPSGRSKVKMKDISRKIPEIWLVVSLDLIVPSMISIALLCILPVRRQQSDFAQLQQTIPVPPAVVNLGLSVVFGIFAKLKLDEYNFRGALTNQDPNLFNLNLISLKHTNQISDEQIRYLKYANMELVEREFADLIKTLETVKLSPLSLNGKPQFIFDNVSKSKLDRLAAKVQKAHSTITKINTNNYKVSQYQERGKMLLQISLDLIETFNNKTTSKEKLQSHANDLARLIEQENGNPYLVLILAILGVLLKQQALYKQTTEYVDHIFRTKAAHLNNAEDILDRLAILKLLNIRFNHIHSRRRRVLLD